MAGRGFVVGKGTIVDATIINAPPSTKNDEKKRDPEMHQTPKGNRWFFWMKVTETDAHSGLVHTVQARPKRPGLRSTATSAASNTRR